MPSFKKIYLEVMKLYQFFALHVFANGLYACIIIIFINGSRRSSSSRRSSGSRGSGTISSISSSRSISCLFSLMVLVIVIIRL